MTSFQKNIGTLVISRYIRTIFEKSTSSAVGSSFVIVIGLILFVVAFLMSSALVSYVSTLVKGAAIRQLMGIIIMLVTFLPGLWCTMVGIQTLLRRRKIELTPDGLYYLNYDFESAYMNGWEQFYVVSHKQFLSWKEIHSIEIEDSCIKIQKLLFEGQEEKHSYSLTGFDAPAEVIYANVIDYHNRYKNGYELVADSGRQTISIFQWNTSASLILLLSVLYLGMQFLFTSEFFNELAIVQSFDQSIENIFINFSERAGMNNVNENTVSWLFFSFWLFFFTSSIYQLPYFILWFFIVAAMWKAIPSEFRKLNPYLAAFLSITPIFGVFFDFIVLRGWAECLNKAAGRNGQTNICIVGLVNLFCIIGLLWEIVIVGCLVEVNNGNNIEGTVQALEMIVVMDKITFAMFLLYVVSCVRFLNPVPKK
jgi:hypothetical protein